MIRVGEKQAPGHQCFITNLYHEFVVFNVGTCYNASGSKVHADELIELMDLIP